MDTADYLPTFPAEGREHLRELHLAVVRSGPLCVREAGGAEEVKAA